MTIDDLLKMQVLRLDSSDALNDCLINPDLQILYELDWHVTQLARDVTVRIVDQRSEVLAVAQEVALQSSDVRFVVSEVIERRERCGPLLSIHVDALR